MSQMTEGSRSEELTRTKKETRKLSKMIYRADRSQRMRTIKCIYKLYVQSHVTIFHQFKFMNTDHLSQPQP